MPHPDDSGWGFVLEKMHIEELYRIFKRHPFICTDSRKIVRDSVFFALKGNSFDGNTFAEEAIGAGCSYAVVDDPSVVRNQRFLLVDNVLDALQQLATLHRKHISVPVLAITGSNGKTTTKELCFSVLTKQYRVVATMGNLNNHIGVPLTILSIHEGTDVAIVEMGANHPGEISHLCQIAQPGLGIITNIGRAHLEGFGSFEGIINAKNELYKYIKDTGGTLFVNLDNELLQSLSASIPRITYGTSGPVSVMGSCLSTDPYLAVSIALPEQEQQRVVTTHMTGRYNLENILAAWAVGIYFNVHPDRMAEAISEYVPANMRSQILETSYNRVIMDAYNANPSSMDAALRNFASLGDPNKSLILGDMLELGSFSQHEHQRILGLVTELGIAKGILVGKQFSVLVVPEGFKAFLNAGEASEYLVKHPLRNGTILIKGSRAIGLEQLIDLL
jgi:UDP-N-acetylmuramoyl-tripeptide--D-alanyl-D-alanine ligase